MKEQPKKVVGVRLCMALTADGLTAYGNKEAFAALAEWMSWLANSNERDHFECHVTMSLEDDASLFEGKRPRNIWTLIHKNLSGMVASRSDNSPGFELTFMTVEQADLDYMAQFQEAGKLPDDWNTADD